MVRCAKCRIELPQDSEGKTCPECGEIEREIVRIVNEEIRIAERLRGREKRKGPHSYDLKFGHDLYVETGKWYWIVQEIDKRKIYADENWYRKKIIDPETGTVIRDTSEPLHLHQGYGSAKKKRKL